MLSENKQVGTEPNKPNTLEKCRVCSKAQCQSFFLLGVAVKPKTNLKFLQFRTNALDP